MPDIESMLNLFEPDEYDSRSKEEQISIKKRMGKVLNISRTEAKLETCFHCGKKVDSFCNSHSIPAFSLRKIASNGKLYHSNRFTELTFMSDESGVNNSGTFKLICRECDSKAFADYENTENYSDEISVRMIAQIAMKNFLKNISKRHIEIRLFQNLKDNHGLSESYHDEKQDIHDLDLKEFIAGYSKAKRVNEKNKSGEYYVFYRDTLDYVTPMAFQNSITMVADLEGNMINNIYNMSPNYHTKEVHISVFPMDNKTEIIMFIDTKDKVYRNFYRQFKKLKHEDKLLTIAYIIFIYSEDIFFSKDIDDDILTSEALRKASRVSTDVVSDSPMIDGLSIALQNFNLDKRHEIPNILSERYKLR